MPEISIIVLTFNSSKFIKSCLDSIFTQNYRDFETIVVDSGSKDSTVSFIKEYYQQVVLIENNRNFGACKARNQGIEISRGKWILTLDCDVILEKNFLQEITSFTSDSEENVGMLQPKIFKNDKKTIYSCGIYLSRLRRFYDVGKRRQDNKRFDRIGYIFGACSAAALYKRQMLDELKEETGYFDERFFFLAEDVDLAWRAQRKGWKGIFLPSAKCYHYENSSDSDRKFRQYLCFRNRYYTIKKNEGFFNYNKTVFPSLFYDLPRLLYMIFTNRHILKKVFLRNRF